MRDFTNVAAFLVSRLKNTITRKVFFVDRPTVFGDLAFVLESGVHLMSRPIFGRLIVTVRQVDAVGRLSGDGRPIRKLFGNR